MKFSSIIITIAAGVYLTFGLIPTKTSADILAYLSSADSYREPPAANAPAEPCVAWEFRSPYPFALHSAAVATDGVYTYVFGGSSNGGGFADVKRYDPATNMWTLLEPLPFSTESRLKASYGGNGKIYVMGGSANPTLNRIYDIASNSWSAGAPVPIPITFQSQAYSNGKIYVVGGRSGVTPTASVFAYDIATNTWSPLASLPAPRYDAAAAVINGKIYIAGGTADGFSPVNSLLIYDIAANVWSGGPSMAGEVWKASGLVMGGKLWVVGGGTPQTTTTTRVFDPVTNTWGTGPSLNEAREHAGAVSFNSSGGDTALIVGGFAFGSSSNSVESIATDCGSPSPTPTPSITPIPSCVSWEYKAQYPIPVTEMATATDGSSVYVFGGRTFQAITDTANRYDPGTDSWVPLQNMPNGPDSRLFAQYGGNGKIYVMGGTTGGSLNRIYDIATNTWSSGAQIPGSLVHAGHAYSNGRIFVIGGRSGGIVQSAMSAYNVASDTWTPLAPMPVGRFGTAVGVIGGKIYVVGGTADGFNSLTSFYVYDIAANTWTTGPNLPTAAKLAGGVVYDGEFWVLGGSTSTDQALSLAQVYNPQANSWRAGTSFSEPRERPGTVTLSTSGGTKMFAVGGVTIFSNLSNTLEASLPVCTATPTPTPSPTATPVATPTPAIPLPSTSPAPVVRDGSVDREFSLTVGESGAGEVTSVTPAGTDGKLYVGGAFGSILGVAASNVARVFQDGVVDQSFNVGSGANAIVRRLVVQPDGKLLVSGAFTSFNGIQRRNIVRLNQDGSVDTTFEVTSNGDQQEACGVQSDGRIFVCGNFTTINGASRKQLARLQPSGAPDLSFDFGTGIPGSGSVRAIRQLSDGKILLGGNFSSINGTNRESVARLNSDGTVDSSYILGTNMSFVLDIRETVDGRFVFTSINRLVKAMPDGSLDPSFTSDNSFTGTARFSTPLASGKILVGGDLTQVRVGTFFLPIRGLVRLNANGTIDLSYTSPFAGSTSPSIQAGYLDPAGRLTLGGGSLSVGTEAVVGLIRFNSDGTRDLSFIGRVLARGTIFASLLEPDGKIMVGGSFDTLNATRRKFVARINATDGSVDETFVPDSAISNGVRAMARQSDGKYIVASFGTVAGSNLVWRLNSDGSRDTSFEPPTFNSNSFVGAVALQTDGKILIGGGFSSVNGAERISFARLNSDGTLDSLAVTFGSTSAQITSLLVQPDGKMVLGGSFITPNGAPGISNLARLNTDGSTDLQFSANHGGTFSPVRSVTAIGGNIYVGGTLNRTGVNDSRSTVVKMTPGGVVDLGFNAGRLVGSAYSVAAAPYGKLFVGGTFNTFGESGSRRALVRILPNGALDYTFDAGPIDGNNGPTSEAVYNILPLEADKIFVAGSFNSIASMTRWSAARLSLHKYVTRSPSDFDGDGRTDIALFRPSNAAWYWLKSYGGEFRATSWGAATDRIVPADYDGDGITDIAAFRPAEGRWYILSSSANTFLTVSWGTQSDKPAPADFDGDGRADLSIFRPSDGRWWIDRTLHGAYSVQFGQQGDEPVVADYDADGRADIGIYRPSRGEWWIDRSSVGGIALQFGSSSDLPVQGDFTGDRKADIAFWRPSTGEWYVLRSEDLSYFAFPFGSSGDLPAPGDYDGDGKFDAAVFRPSNATWYIGRTTAGTHIAQFGATGDQPVANAFVP